MTMRYGDGNDCYFIPTQAISGTTPVVSFVTPSSAGALDMRDFDDVSMQLITSGTITGTWLIEASNDFVAFMNGNAYGATSGSGTVTPAATGQWTDVTALFKVPAGTAVVNPAGSATNQFVRCPNGIRCRALRITLTPASGAGNVTVIGNVHCWGG